MYLKDHVKSSENSLHENEGESSACHESFSCRKFAKLITRFLISEFYCSARTFFFTFMKDFDRKPEGDVIAVPSRGRNFASFRVVNRRATTHHDFDASSGDLGLDVEGLEEGSLLGSHAGVLLGNRHTAGGNGAGLGRGFHLAGETKLFLNEDSCQKYRTFTRISLTLSR